MSKLAKSEGGVLDQSIATSDSVIDLSSNSRLQLSQMAAEVARKGFERFAEVKRLNAKHSDQVMSERSEPTSIAVGQSFASYGRPRISTPESIDLSRIQLRPRPTFVSLREWEGYVVAIKEDSLVADLIDLSANASRPTEQAEIPLAELSEFDRKKVSLGSVFRWAIGYYREPAGTKMRASQIVFRELPQWTPRDIAQAKSDARAMSEALRNGMEPGSKRADTSER